MKITTAQLEAFRKKCQKISESSNLNLGETKAMQIARIQRAKEDYNYFFTTYLSHYCTDNEGKIINCAAGHIEIANYAKSNKQAKIVYEAYRGYAKSVHSSIGMPLWLKMQGQLRFFVLVGENENKAITLLSDIQAELEFNTLYNHDFGSQKGHGSWENGKFSTADGCKFYSLGIQQDPAGLRNAQYRPDYIVVDDVDTLEKCNNQQTISKNLEWITSTLMGCFAADGMQRMILANNRIHQKSILVGFLNEMKIDKNFRHWQINCLDSNNESSWIERHTTEFWLDKKSNTAHRAFQRNYMNNPIQDGKLFKAKYLQYRELPKVSEWSTYYDVIVGYWDFSYKKEGDYKAYCLVGKRTEIVENKAKIEYHVLKVFCRQVNASLATSWFYDLDKNLTTNGVHAIHYIEGNASQETVFIPLFNEEGNKRGWYVPLISDTTQKGNKFMRIESTLSAPFENRQIVWNNDLETDNDGREAIDQLLAFQQGSTAKDDFPDALESAIAKIMRYYGGSHGGDSKPIFGKIIRKGF